MTVMMTSKRVPNRLSGPKIPDDFRILGPVGRKTESRLKIERLRCLGGGGKGSALSTLEIAGPALIFLIPGSTRWLFTYLAGCMSCRFDHRRDEDRVRSQDDSAN